MINHIFFIKVFLFLLSLPLLSQEKSTVNSKPKLVVGIVVDQMRNDYLYRYWDRYSSGGFRRLINQGFSFKNAHYNFIPTYTGPGHSSIYTGATPRAHGIIANDWFMRANAATIYCVSDTSVRSVGTDSKTGRVSPKNQLSSTIGDELKMSSNQKAKVFAIAIKDRSAILPAGHAANGAYWFDDASASFISSTWYCESLPNWLTQFNSLQLPKKYLEKGWNTLYPIATYTNSIADNNSFEGTPFKSTPTFPYTFESYLNKNSYNIIKGTPFGNSLTKDLAIACIKNELLGQGNFTDLLSISFSSSDIVGHSFGTRAVEIEDLYLRLDLDITEILNTLDREVGKDNYTVFLTADHGGADVPSHLLQNKIPAGYINETELLKELKKYFNENYNDTLLIDNLSNEQIFLNSRRITEKLLTVDAVEENLCRYLRSIKGIAEAYPSSVLRYGTFNKNDYRALLQNGYNHKLSGNVCFLYQPAWMDYAEKGTTHGSGYNYDTHVPILFYGHGITKGQTFSYTTITQIAPSICELLQINQPNSCNAEPLNNFFK